MVQESVNKKILVLVIISILSAFYASATNIGNIDSVFTGNVNATAFYDDGVQILPISNYMILLYWTNITDRITVYRNQTFHINVTACDPDLEAGCN